MKKEEIEKLAYNMYPDITSTWMNPDKRLLRDGFIVGFQKAESLNDETSIRFAGWIENNMFVKMRNPAHEESYGKWYVPMNSHFNKQVYFTTPELLTLFKAIKK